MDNGILALAFYITCFGAWLTSIFHAVETSNVVLAIVDILIFPAGVLHGVYLWLT